MAFNQQNLAVPPPPFSHPLFTTALIRLAQPYYVVLQDLAQAADVAMPDPSTTPLADESGLLTTPWIMWFNAVRIAIGSGPTGGGNVAEETYTLIINTVITPITPPMIGAQLAVFIIQDATGGRQITWGSNVKWATVEIDTTALTVSLFRFLGRVDPTDGVTRWFCDSLVMTGQTP